MTKFLIASAALICFLAVAALALAADKPKVGGDSEPVWRGVDFAPHEIEFLCINNPHMSEPFRLRIVDDIHRKGRKLPCRDFSTINDTFLEQLRNNGRSAVWLITPTLVKILRDIDFKMMRIDVRSYRVVRLGVATLNLSNRVCATGRFKDKIYDTEFSVTELTLMRGTIRHDEESPGHIDLKLSSVHDSVKTTLEPLNTPENPLDLCKALLDGGFDFLQQGWVSGHRSALEHRVLVHQGYPKEMESLVSFPSLRDLKTREECGGGTGFFIKVRGTEKSSNLILTNYHVVSCNANGLVKYSSIDSDNYRHLVGVGVPIYGLVIYYDERRDLALVRGNVPGPSLEINDRSHHRVKVTDEVLALGHPGPVEYYTTEGIVSRIAMDCELPQASVTKSNSAPIKCIQTDAAINQGNSGGPLLSKKTRKVVGVNTFIQAFRPIPIPFPGLSWAIHYEEIQSFLEDAGVFERGE